MAQKLSLISAPALAVRLQSVSEAPSVRQLLLLDVSTGGVPPLSFIPGAVAVDMSEVDVYELEGSTMPRIVSGNYSLRPAAELRLALERIGIHTHRPVVIYSQCEKSAPIAAARLAWCLAFAGVGEVALLQAGVRGWINAGLPLSSTAAPRPAAVDFHLGEELPFPLHPRFCTDTAEVSLALEKRKAWQSAGSAGAAGCSRGLQSGALDGSAGGSSDALGGSDCSGTVLADVRSWREFVGESHDYPYPMPCGRLPGAR